MPLREHSLPRPFSAPGRCWWAAPTATRPALVRSSCPYRPTFPHEDGAPVQLLFRPEQTSLSVETPAGEAVVIGRGTVIEQNFTGASHRLRLRLPRLPATRQVAPAVTFGEEGLIVDAVIPAGVSIAARSCGWRCGVGISCSNRNLGCWSMMKTAVFDSEAGAPVD